MSHHSAQRAAQIAANLARVTERIARAADAAGRAAEEITLVVVTKYFPASDVQILADLGVRHVGENRHQEARAKAEACSHLGLTWHFIGGLQSNKAAAVARYAQVVESVDRLKVLNALDAEGRRAGEPVPVLLQVSLDPPGREHRAGVAPGELAALAAAADAAPGVSLRGLMAVAPLGEEPGAAFARLAQVRAGFLAEHPEAVVCSAGMSGDLEHAVKHGATHVRVGSAVLGSRPVSE